MECFVSKSENRVRVELVVTVGIPVWLMTLLCHTYASGSAQMLTGKVTESCVSFWLLH